MDRMPYWVGRAAAGFRAARHGWKRAKGARVWMFHGVVEKWTDAVLQHNFTTLERFRECISVFRRLRPLSLDELCAYLTRGQQPPEDGCLITFDDGYRNNLLACEELGKYGMRAVIHICPGIPPGRTIWPAEVNLLLIKGGLKAVELLGRKWDLSDDAKRADACRQIRRELKKMPAGKRMAAIGELEAQFPRGKVEELVWAHAELQLLSKDEVVQLQNAGHGIGSHGMQHEVHNENQELEVLRAEIEDSKREIETMTGKKCLAFAYPNGDARAESAEILREAGYLVAFTTERGCLAGRLDPYRIPRMEGSRREAAIRDAFYLAARI